jgi:hypothetical protein
MRICDKLYNIKEFGFKTRTALIAKIFVDYDELLFDPYEPEKEHFSPDDFIDKLIYTTIGVFSDIGNFHILPEIKMLNNESQETLAIIYLAVMDFLIKDYTNLQADGFIGRGMIEKLTTTRNASEEDKKFKREFEYGLMGRIREWVASDKLLYLKNDLIKAVLTKQLEEYTN